LEQDIFDKENQKTFRNVSVAEHYVGMTTLFPPEARALEKIRNVVRGRPIMDVGVGTGRTTPYLMDLSTEYIGLDYSPEMIAKCCTQFPGVRFEVADARRLDAYPTGHFGMVMFSFNGIDYVQHSDRLAALSECHRLLGEGGIFLFSSHNELWDQRADRPVARRVLGRIKDSIRYIRYLKSMGPIRYKAHGYSYRCERVFGTTQTVISYYITPEAQIKQLHLRGFVCNEIFNCNGDELRPGMREANPSPWLYYLAHKISGAGAVL
jgi:ubiquinone/menaquinone biosynthesis C-methylase UbiE